MHNFQWGGFDAWATSPSSSSNRIHESVPNGVYLDLPIVTCVHFVIVHWGSRSNQARRTPHICTLHPLHQPPVPYRPAPCIPRSYPAPLYPHPTFTPQFRTSPSTPHTPHAHTLHTRFTLQGAISAGTIKKVANLRAEGVKFAIITGARLSTLLMRLPYLPAADAFVCENGAWFMVHTLVPGRCNSSLALWPIC